MWKNKLCHYPQFLNPHKLSRRHIGKFCTICHIHHINSTLTYNRISSSSCRKGIAVVARLWGATVRWMPPLLKCSVTPTPAPCCPQGFQNPMVPHISMVGQAGRSTRSHGTQHLCSQLGAACSASWCQATAHSSPLPTPGCLQPQGTPPYRGLGCLLPSCCPSPRAAGLLPPVSQGWI